MNHTWASTALASVSTGKHQWRQPQEDAQDSPPEYGGLPANPFASLALPLVTKVVISDTCLSLFLLSLSYCIVARVMLLLLYCTILQWPWHSKGGCFVIVVWGQNFASVFVIIDPPSTLPPMHLIAIVHPCWLLNDPYTMDCSVCWFWHHYSYQNPFLSINIPTTPSISQIIKKVVI